MDKKPAEPYGLVTESDQVSSECHLNNHPQVGKPNGAGQLGHLLQLEV